MTIRRTSRTCGRRRTEHITCARSSTFLSAALVQKYFFAEKVPREVAGSTILNGGCFHHHSRGLRCSEAPVGALWPICHSQPEGVFEGACASVFIAGGIWARRSGLVD